jgi:hypothetical protein
MSERRLVPVLLTIALLAAIGGIAANSGDDDREFKAVLTGANEVPPVDTDTSGKAEFEVNRDQTKIKFELKIRNATKILGVAGAHIHCAPEGVNGPIVAFLAGPVTGGFDGKVEIEATLTAENITNTACGATIADLVQSMRDGDTYVNAHSPAFPGGEVRGQIEGD